MPSRISPVGSWAILVAVAALVGAGLAAAAFARFDGNGRGLATWDPPIVVFTFIYSAFVGALAGGLAGIAPLMFTLRARARAEFSPGVLVGSMICRLLGAVAVAALVLVLHGGEVSGDYIVAAATWVGVGWAFDWRLAKPHRD